MLKIEQPTSAELGNQVSQRRGSTAVLSGIAGHYDKVSAVAVLRYEATLSDNLA
ncbi:hypothetical protein [Mycobacteroides abscessus]|uniref:hypothetical protein n=1 Tax=Mycobacteroides abscessus TaxID=36809 RepID=UPI0013FD0471|nr:hypothetical protein [Mycobacteroides abscessus]